MEAIDTALPGLRQQVHNQLRIVHAEAGVENGSDGFVVAIWPAVLACVVAFTTQAGERPAHRAPLEHVVFYSFDTFADHLGQLGSRLDDLDIQSTLGVGLEVVGAALGVGAGLGAGGVGP